MALKIFTSARGALEANRGTDLTPTRIWYGESFTHVQDVKTIRPKNLGSYDAWNSAAAGVETNTLTWSGRLSYNQSLLLGNLFFGPCLTGVGGAADKAYLFPISQTADDIKTATIELGYSDTIATAPAVELNYLFPSTLHLHWEKNDDAAVLFDATFLVAGAAEQITAFTGALSDTVETMLSSNATTVYVDTTTIGTTAAPEVRSVDFNLDLHPVPFYGLNGSTAASAVYRPDAREWTADVQRRYATGGEWTTYAAKTERKMRIKTLGPALGGSNYIHQLDLYGVWDSRADTDVDGVVVEDLHMVQLKDSGIVGSMGHTVTSSETTIA